MERYRSLNIFQLQLFISNLKTEPTNVKLIKKLTKQPPSLKEKPHK